MMGLTVLSFHFLIPMDASMDATIQWILFIYLIVFPIVMLYTLRYALHIFLFVLAFISGFYGFYHYSVENHSISNALYFTFRLYLLDLADVFTQDGSSPIQYPLLLEIARWTAASYTISTIFIAVYRTLEKKILLFFIQLTGKHHVIFGYNEKSHHLIQNLRLNKERVIVVDERFSSETENQLEAMKVLMIQTSLNEENVFRLCSANKAKSISIFFPEDQANLYILLKLEQFFQHQKVQHTLKKILIHIEDARYKVELRSFLETVHYIPVEVKVFNVCEEVAKRFWEKHPLILEQSESAHLLIVGYDILGKAIAEEAEKIAQLNLQDENFTMTILDAFSTYEQQGHVEKIPFDSEEDSLATVIKNHSIQFTQIFICLEEDYLDLMEGIELSEIFPLIPIYMHFTDESIQQTFRIVTTTTAKSLFSTGTIKDVLTTDYLGV